MTAVDAPSSATASRSWALTRKVGGSPLVIGVGSVLSVGLLWELFGRQFPSVASYPSAVGSALVEMIGDGTLLSALADTLAGMAVGFLVAAVLGIVIGFTMGRIPLVAGLVEPYVNALYATPRIVLIPLLVLWVGIGFELRVTVAVLVAIFPVIVNTYVGASNVDAGLMDVGRSFNAGSLQLLRTVVIPASLPFVVVGLRIGGFRALVGIIVAEMTASVTGTGQLILTHGRFVELAPLIAVIFTLGIIGVVFTKLMGAAEKAAMPWSRRGRT